MVHDLAYVGVKKEWPVDVSRKRAYEGSAIKNGAAHDLLCEIDDELYPLVQKLASFLEKMGYEPAPFEIPESFKKIVEEGREK